MTRLLVPIPEARERLGGIGHTTIYALFNNGDLTKVNLGRRSFVTEESLAALVDRLTAEATTQMDSARHRGDLHGKPRSAMRGESRRRWPNSPRGKVAQTTARRPNPHDFCAVLCTGVQHPNCLYLPTY
jgi:hypothetical protein